MNIKLGKLLDEFGKGLTKSKYDSYMPILRNSFIPYLENTYQIQLEDSLDELFDKKISPEDIVNGGVYYIDNTPKVTNESAIDKYLTATSEFFKAVIFPSWKSCSLSTVGNFQKYHQDIFDKKTKSLKEYKTRTHLERNSVKIVLGCLYELEDLSLKNEILKAVIPLILLYGFKIGIVTDIKRENYDSEKRIIMIDLEDDKVNLELPYNVWLYIDKIYNRNIDDVYLFNVGKDQKLVSDYFDGFLVKCNKRINTETKITLDGLAKYAVINMLIEGMDSLIVKQISGMKDTELKYCQQEAWKVSKSEIQLNRYVNTKMQEMSIYNELCN